MQYNRRVDQKSALQVVLRGSLSKWRNASTRPEVSQYFPQWLGQWFM